MEYNIKEQIDTWTRKLHYYENKDTQLLSRITQLESQRKFIDALPVGSPMVDRYYRQMDNLIGQRRTLPSKILKCKDYISTLKCEL